MSLTVFPDPGFPWTVSGQLICGIKIIRHFQKNAFHFKICFPFFINRVIAKPGTKNVSGNSTCGITVAAVVDGSRKRAAEIIRVFQTAVNGYGKGFIPCPSFPEFPDMFLISSFLSRKHLRLYDQRFHSNKILSRDIFLKQISHRCHRLIHCV